MNSQSQSKSPYCLKPDPKDGITRVRFNHHDASSPTSHLLVSSWDGQVRLYDASADCQKLLTTHTCDSPLLDVCWTNNKHESVVGTLSGAVQIINVSTNNTTGSSTTKNHIIGQHDKACCSVEFNARHSHVISGGWDGRIQTFDCRQNPYKSNTNIQLKEKVYSMSTLEHHLVVACSSQTEMIYDLRMLEKTPLKRKNTLKYQYRCVSIFPNGKGYALSSIEGRVAIAYFDPTMHSQQKYAFKCHRKKINNVEHVYPVNTIAFHPVYGTFATGGCDAHVISWDGEKKRRLSHFPNYPTSIASMDFNKEGTLLAVASSYTFEKGSQENTPPDQLFIQQVSQKDFLYRSK